MLVDPALFGALGRGGPLAARGARLRRLVALRLDGAHVLGILLHLPGRDEAHAQHARGAAATLVNIAFTLPWTAAGVSPASRAHAGACVRSQARQVHAHSSRMFGFV